MDDVAPPAAETEQIGARAVRRVERHRVGERGDPPNRTELEQRQALRPLRPQQVGATRRPHQQAPPGEHRHRLVLDEHHVGHVLGGVSRGVQGTEHEPAHGQVLLVEGGEEAECGPGARR